MKRFYFLILALLLLGLLNHSRSSARIDGPPGDTLPDAAEYGELEKVMRLVEDGADIDGRESSGHTALHEAAHHDERAVVEYLISRGADVDVKDIFGNTPLHHIAIWGAEVSTAELLVSGGADVNARDNRGFTPLHRAARYGRSDLVEFLISKGADLNVRSYEDYLSRNGSPWMENALNDLVELAKYIFLKRSVLFNAKRNRDDYLRRGFTPLMEAISEKHNDVIEILKRHGAGK